MTRVAIDLPDKFYFTTTIQIRITDLNYGGHVGNDTVLSLIHEGRMQFLQRDGYSEKDLAGAGLIMGDVSIVFKNEMFYGDVVRISIGVTNISRVSFDLIYKLEKTFGDKMIDVAYAKTGMVCFDYDRKKVISLPEAVRNKWSG